VDLAPSTEPILNGALLAGLAAAALPLLFDPAVYSHFFEFYRTASIPLPLDLPAPTLRNTVKIFLSIDSWMVDYLSTRIGVVGL
jgi:hypothetical protein